MTTLMNINEKKEIVEKRLARMAQKFLTETAIFDIKLSTTDLLEMIKNGELSAREIGNMFSAAIKKEVFKQPPS